jgi:hypothetical protein
LDRAGDILSAFFYPWCPELTSFQIFFSFRIWKIMKHSFIGLLCVALSTARFTACLVLTAGAFREPSFLLFAERYAWLLTTVLVSSASVDVIIAVALCYFLLVQRDNSFGR